MNIFKKVFYSLFYYNEARKNFYPCRLTGDYKTNSQGVKSLYVKNFGNGKFYYLTAKEIFDDSALLEKFSSRDVSLITMIAFDEIQSAADEKAQISDWVNKTLGDIQAEAE